jgi:hypothetical protein
LALGSGPHRLVATSPIESGLDLDRIVLRSVIRDDAGTPAITDGEVAVERLGPDRLRVTVGPVSSADATAPWLIFRESFNAGWEARDESGSLGPAVLIDGYAHGWVLRDGAGPREITLEWTPQRVIGPGLVLSGLFLILVLLLSLGLRRRSGSALATVSAHPAYRQPRNVPTVAVGVGLGLVGGPIAGLTYLIVRWLTGTAGRAPRWIAPATAIGLWGLSSLYTAALQFGFRYPADPDWPSRFAWMSPVVWAGVAAVIAARPRARSTPVRSLE